MEFLNSKFSPLFTVKNAPLLKLREYLENLDLKDVPEFVEMLLNPDWPKELLAYSSARSITEFSDIPFRRSHLFCCRIIELMESK